MNLLKIDYLELKRLFNTCKNGSFDQSLSSNSIVFIKYVSLNKRPCQARPALVNLNSNKTFYYPFIGSVNYQGMCSR